MAVRGNAVRKCVRVNAILENENPTEKLAFRIISSCKSTTAVSKALEQKKS